MNSSMINMRVAVWCVTISLLALTNSSCNRCKGILHTTDPTYEAIVSDENVPDEVRIIMDCYPEQRLKFKDNRFYFPNGTQVIYDDKKEKNFEEMLDDSDIKDMFKMDYCRQDTPTYLADAGRSRCEAFFKGMYGSSPKEVKKNLVRVDWFGKKVRMTRVNGAAKQLSKVAQEMAKHPELEKYMLSSVSFYWRKVRGAQRQSAHSYGIAIDINTEYSNYWLWSNKGAAEQDSLHYENRIPQKIVEIFEKYGFIWGGYWYHFDTMHFEYRPEILRYQTQTDSLDTKTNDAHA